MRAKCITRAAGGAGDAKGAEKSAGTVRLVLSGDRVGGRAVADVGGGTGPAIICRRAHAGLRADRNAHDLDCAAKRRPRNDRASNPSRSGTARKSSCRPARRGRKASKSFRPQSRRRGPHASEGSGISGRLTGRSSPAAHASPAGGFIVGAIALRRPAARGGAVDQRADGRHHRRRTDSKAPDAVELRDAPAGRHRQGHQRRQSTFIRNERR